MSEVRLNCAWRDEKPGGDVLVRKAFADETRHVEFSRRQRRPAARWPVAFAATALSIGDRFVHGQSRTFGPGNCKVVVSKRFARCIYPFVVVGLMDGEPGLAGAAAPKSRPAS